MFIIAALLIHPQTHTNRLQVVILGPGNLVSDVVQLHSHMIKGHSLIIIDGHFVNEGSFVYILYFSISKETKMPLSSQYIVYNYYSNYNFIEEDYNSILSSIFMRQYVHLCLPSKWCKKKLYNIFFCL